MRGLIPAALLCAVLLPSPTHASPTTNYPIMKQPVTGPASAIESYAQAFRDRSPEGIGAVLTADYRFHSTGAQWSWFLDGNARESEMQVVRNLLLGLKRDGNVILPPPLEVSMSVDGVRDNVDPEHPDSTQQYRVLTVSQLGFRVVERDSNVFLNKPSMHVMHVVRGDAAVLVDGQIADPDRWYIRRWIEDITALNAGLREKKGDCGEEPGEPTRTPGAASTPSPPTPGVLGVRALTNPACAALRVQCDLPGRENARVQVYDVSGRMVNERRLDSPTPGTVAVDAGAGAQIMPGLYWVRVVQAKRPPAVRMVVVAR